MTREQKNASEHNFALRCIHASISAVRRVQYTIPSATPLSRRIAGSAEMVLYELLTSLEHSRINSVGQQVPHKKEPKE